MGYLPHRRRGIGIRRDPGLAQWFNGKRNGVKITTFAERGDHLGVGDIVGSRVIDGALGMHEIEGHANFLHPDIAALQIQPRLRILKMNSHKNP